MMATATRLDQSRIELWWAALGAGVVVIVCVVILLTLLSAFVADIDRRLGSAMTETHGAAAQVADSQLITEAAVLIRDLAVELERQAAVVVAAHSETS